ncbi:MAG: 4Fe-4S dicluster domain-containing protein [Rhodomicrobium sp.]
MEDTTTAEAKAIIASGALQTLIGALTNEGYTLLGPTVRDGAIVYDEIARLEDLPAGWTDRQDAATYTLERREDNALFGYAVGPQSWKRILHPPAQTLWSAQKTAEGFEITPAVETSRKYAFLGVRPCELSAIAIQDRVFCGGPYRDQAYAGRRQNAFIIAVNCGTPGGSCFCTSMQTGPKASSGFDLALTELLEGGAHEFLVETGSEAGAGLLAKLLHNPATPEQIALAEAVLSNAVAHMGRSLNTEGLKERLQSNLNHPRWDETAERCLACGNCTMVCPTCFCTTVEDRSDLTGTHAERVRKWDSCFSLDFSYIHGGSVRSATSSRYRQWMTHKLANWFDQFGTSGCVGCGRCITWCPVGIDITEEAAAVGVARTVKEEENNGES